MTTFEKTFEILGIIGLVLIGVFLLFLVIHYIAYSAKNNEEITIKEKWRDYLYPGGTSNKVNNYWINSTDEVFQTNPDLYTYLESGMICNITTQGLRYKLFKSYKTILGADC